MRRKTVRENPTGIDLAGGADGLSGLRTAGLVAGDPDAGRLDPLSETEARRRNAVRTKDIS
jgi:hypothetical protein